MDHERKIGLCVSVVAADSSCAGCIWDADWSSVVKGWASIVSGRAARDGVRCWMGWHTT